MIYARSFTTVLAEPFVQSILLKSIVLFVRTKKYFSFTCFLITSFVCAVCLKILWQVCFFMLENIHGVWLGNDFWAIFTSKGSNIIIIYGCSRNAIQSPLPKPVPSNHVDLFDHTKQYKVKTVDKQWPPLCTQCFEQWTKCFKKYICTQQREKKTGQIPLF